MKTLCLLLLVFLSSSAAALAQTPAKSPDAPGVEVLEISWRKEMRNPMLEGDLFEHNREQLDREREQEEINRINALRAKEGKTAITSRKDNVFPRIETASKGLYATYVYKAKVNNTEAKTIRAVEWEYIFFDPADKSEVGRHRHRSEVKIQPGKRAGLTARTSSPPTKIVNVSKAGKQLKEQYEERVEILRIEYADGSTWQRPSK